MQFFYDGQVRRYLTQTIRAFSNFVVKYGDGSLHQVPVMYGDPDRAVASIIRQNSENVVNSVPRISIYISGLDLDRDRLADQSFVSKLNFRERDVNNSGQYTTGQGRNYTVERLMPTPYKLTMKCDIWSSSTEQKLQILEQILVLFNPSLELQTTDNYIDWTSISVLNLGTISWSSRQVPVGNDTPIEVASLTLDSPIWISPPVKVKHLGVITKIIASIHNGSSTYPTGYEAGLGIDPAVQGDGSTTSFSSLLATETTTITGYTIQIYNGQATLLNQTDGFNPMEPTLGIPTPTGNAIDWNVLFSQYPGQYVAGSSTLYLQQPNGTYVIGTIAINSLDSTKLTVNYNPDSLTSNTGIDSSGYLSYDVSHYNAATSYRPASPGTFDAIINPLTYNPGTVASGTRYLIIEDIGYTYSNNTYSSTTTYQTDDVVLYQNHYYKSISSTSFSNILPTDISKWLLVEGATAWRAGSGVDLVAKANDIIEYAGSGWQVIFNSSQETTTMVWQTNIYTGVQYLWNGVSWVKSFEGEYTSDQWKIVL